MTRNYSKEDFEQMDNPTLVAASYLLTKGRQYEGIEEEKDFCLQVMSKRLQNENEEDIQVWS